MYSYADLEGLLKPGKIRLNESMARHTTFRVGGRADALCLPETRYDLVEVTGCYQNTRIKPRERYPVAP